MRTGRQPIFALTQHYPQGQPSLLRLDLHRLEGADAADDLFCQKDEEAQAMGALLVVEWQERPSLACPDAWTLTLDHGPGGCCTLRTTALATCWALWRSRRLTAMQLSR